MSQITQPKQNETMTTKTPLTAAQRKAKSRAGKKVVTIELTQEELDLLTARFEENAYDCTKKDFYKNCLLLGMKFQRNMGRPKGDKVKG